MKIQDIINKLDEFDAICPVCKSGIRKFLQSSLTSLLDSIEKEALDKIPVGMKRSRKEVINIINSHK